MKNVRPASSTAVIRYRDAEYTLAMSNCELFGSFGLDENWRSMNYAQGDSALALSVRGTVLLPADVPMPLADLLGGASEEDQQAAQIALEIDIGHTRMDAPDSFVSYPLSDLPLFPNLHDMQDYTANEAVCAQSGFWLGAISTLAKVTEIRIFGKGATRTVRIAGVAGDATGDVSFVLSFAALPFSIVMNIAGYADEFSGTTIAQRQSEILNCFASIYDAKAFDATLEYAATLDASMRYRFVPKLS